MRGAWGQWESVLQGALTRETAGQDGKIPQYGVPPWPENVPGM